MKSRNTHFLFPLVFVFFVVSCEKPIETLEAGLEGQVYTNKGPVAHVPYQSIINLQVLDASTLTVVTELSSNSDGTFRVTLSPGSYFLVIKGAPLTTKTGPFEVQSGQFSQAEANYVSPSV